jgi:hypothetical protein
MGKIDHCPFSDQAKQRAHALVRDFTLKLNSDLQTYLIEHRRLPDQEDDGHGHTMCQSIRQNKEWVALGRLLERYDEGKIDAEAVVGVGCVEGPFIGP